MITGSDFPISQEALDVLFCNARTYPKFQDRPVSEETLRRIHALLRMAPTAQNCQPARFVFVASAEAKERLIPTMLPGNVEKVKSAPVTAIIAYDLKFYERLPELWHDPKAKDQFENNPDAARETAFRNGTLQGAYLIIAARAVGLDCGPMSGFDPEKVNRTFFVDYPNLRANFMCNLGYGDPSSLYPRGPRPDFESVASIL